jgi:hypothetical protein
MESGEFHGWKVEGLWEIESLVGLSRVRMTLDWGIFFCFTRAIHVLV